MDIVLEEILAGMPGITPVEGADLLENCVTMLHRSRHISPTAMALTGLTSETTTLHWEDNFNDQMDRTYADHSANTERAAVCVSVLLAKKLTDYTVILRSRRGTGIDYFLGNADDTLFQPKARLEISDIEKEDGTNSTARRFREKATQAKLSDNGNLPAYISIIEFSHPKALFNDKKTL